LVIEIRMSKLSYFRNRNNLNNRGLSIHIVANKKSHFQSSVKMGRKNVDKNIDKNNKQ